MNEAEVEVLSLNPEPRVDPRIIDLINAGIEVDEDEYDSETLLEGIFDGYRIIDQIMNHEVDKYQGLKDYLNSLKKLLESVKRTKIPDDYIHELMGILEEADVVINGLIANDPSEEQIASDLDTILIRIEDLMQKVQREEMEKGNPELKKKPYVDLLQLDRLYGSLYKAIEENNIKKITLYRGRIIRELKRRQKMIGHHYDDVRGLIEIKELLDSNRSFEEIKECIEKYSGAPFYEALKGAIRDLRTFQIMFEKVYKEYQVRKIELYKDALKQEIKDQKEDLKKRYSSEFLEKKGTVGSLVNVLPNAIGLAIKDVANSVDDYNVAKTNRKKASKLMEILKSAGKLIATPVIYLGKFIASNWYTLFMLQKGLQNAKTAKEAEEARVKSEERAQKESQDRNNAIKAYRRLHPNATEEEAIKAVDENAKITSYENQVRTYNDQYRAAQQARSEQEVEARGKAISAYRKLHPNMSEEEAAKVVDENAKRADYDTQARSYHDVWVQKQQQMTDQNAIDRENAIKAYRRLHPSADEVEAARIVDETAKKASYSDQIRAYQDSYDMRTRQINEQHNKDRADAIRAYQKLHPSASDEEAARIVDETSRKASYEDQARAYHDSYERRMEEVRTKHVADRAEAIKAFRRLHPNMTEEEAGKYVDQAAKRTDYDNLARNYQETYVERMKQREVQTANDRAEAIKAFRRLHPNMTEDEASRIVDEAAKKTDYDHLARNYQEIYVERNNQREAQTANDRSKAISGYRRLHPNMSEEEAARVVDENAKVAGYDIQARTYQDAFVKQQEAMQAQRLAEREKAIGLYQKLHPEVDVEEATKVVDENAKRADYETQARTYQDQIEAKGNTYHLPKNQEEADAMEEAARKKAEELGVEVKPLDEQDKPEDSKETGRCTTCHTAANETGAPAIQEPLPTEEKPLPDNYNREEVVGKFMTEAHMTRDQAEQACDRLEESLRNNPAPATSEQTIRAMTPEEIEAFEKQQENKPSGDGWVLLDGMPYIPSFPIPRFLADMFIQAGYVEQNGILYSPGSIMIQEGIDSIGGKSR